VRAQRRVAEQFLEHAIERAQIQQRLVDIKRDHPSRHVPLLPARGSARASGGHARGACAAIARGDQLMVDRVCERLIRADTRSMEYVNSVHDRRWVDEDAPGAKGYEYIEIVAADSEYTSAFSCELVHDPPRGRA
jgi:hypothetical protein